MLLALPVKVSTEAWHGCLRAERDVLCPVACRCQLRRVQVHTASTEAISLDLASQQPTTGPQALIGVVLCVAGSPWHSTA